MMSKTTGERGDAAQLDCLLNGLNLLMDDLADTAHALLTLDRRLGEAPGGLPPMATRVAGARRTGLAYLIANREAAARIFSDVLKIQVGRHLEASRALIELAHQQIDGATCGRIDFAEARLLQQEMAEASTRNLQMYQQLVKALATLTLLRTSAPHDTAAKA